MSEQKNVETVQQNYAAVGRGDIPTLLSLLSDEVEWSMPGPSVIPWTGTRRGRQQVAEFFACSSRRSNSSGSSRASSSRKVIPSSS